MLGVFRNTVTNTVTNLENLSLNEVAYAGLGHDGDGDGVLDLDDHGRVRGASNTAIATDVCGDALQGHDGAGTGGLGNL